MRCIDNRLVFPLDRIGRFLVGVGMAGRGEKFVDCFAWQQNVCRCRTAADLYFGEMKRCVTLLSKKWRGGVEKGAMVALWNVFRFFKNGEVVAAKAQQPRFLVCRAKTMSTRQQPRPIPTPFPGPGPQQVQVQVPSAATFEHQFPYHIKKPETDRPRRIRVQIRHVLKI